MFLFRTLGRLVGIATITSTLPSSTTATTMSVSSNPVVTSTGSTEIATLAGGCFWCIEAVYNEMDAVLKAESGYMGGAVKNPTYEMVRVKVQYNLEQYSRIREHQHCCCFAFSRYVYILH